MQTVVLTVNSSTTNRVHPKIKMENNTTWVDGEINIKTDNYVDNSQYHQCK